MSRVPKLLSVVGLVVVISSLVLIISLELANLNDESLNPEVKRILDEKQLQMDDAQNGYFTQIGVNGPDDVTPHTWGLRRLTAAIRADSNGRGVSDILADQDKWRFHLPQGSPCKKIDHCLEEVAEHPDVARRILAQAQSKLNRCDTTLDYSHYQEPKLPHTVLASSIFVFPSGCRELQSIRFALAVAEHQDELALTYLDDVIEFHTLQLQGSISLLAKIVAILYLRYDYNLINQYLLLRPDESRKQISTIEKMLAPLNEKGRSLAVVLKSEFAYTANGMLDIRRPIDSENSANTENNSNESLFEYVLFRLPYLPNATVNEYYSEFRPILNLEQSTGQAYSEHVMALETAKNAENRGSGKLYTLRNPAGHILALIGRTDFLPYLRARDDLLALRALVKFHLDIIARRITDSAEIEQALEQKKIFHRFTGKVCSWNKKDRTLYFKEDSASTGKMLAIRM